jgi:hypothetical protein
MQCSNYKDYENHMNKIRKESPIGLPLDGDNYLYAEEYLSWHVAWPEFIEEHGPAEAIFVEQNPDVPPYRDSTDQNQFWVHFADGEREVFSYKISHSNFGHNLNHPDLVFGQHLRQIKSAARHIIRPLHEELKHRSGLSGPLDVHHENEPFQWLLFRFLRDELKLQTLQDLVVIGTDDIGTKRFDPQSVSDHWYQFHKDQATLVVMTKEAHKQWHVANGKDSGPNWLELR